jgi:beta-glucanase (GH16 family)
MTSVSPSFYENFRTLNLWNGTSGTWDTNYWYNTLTSNGGSLPSNSEQEWYINSNDPATASVKPWSSADGILTITGAAASASIQPLIDNYKYTSGELNTYHSFSQEYGYFEMKAELPAGQGMWPAFWMLPENGNWPPEIDIMEVLGNSPTTLYTTIHSGTSSSEVNNGIATTVANTSTGYHTYAVDWTPTTITWYFDNQAVFTAATPSDMNSPMYMELNLAMGGSWPGDVDPSTTLPAQMRVADVEAYTSNPLSDLPTHTYTANGKANQLIMGHAGNDVFNAGTNSVIMTADGLTDTFNFSALPTSHGQITDFDPGTDTINVTGLLQSVGYTGDGPFTDGTLTLDSDGKGGTFLEYHAAASSPGQIIVELDNVAPSAIDIMQDITPAGIIPGGAETLTANNTAGQALTADVANATFYAEQSSAVMTEDGGQNFFEFTAVPWSSGEITNFNPSNDTINLTAMLQAAGYTGSNPFGDGTLTLSSDGNGGTLVAYNPPGAGSNGIWSTTVVDIQHVVSSSLDLSKDFVVSANGLGSPGSSGEVLMGDNTPGQVLTAMSPNATFNAGENSVFMTEDGGSNTFVFDNQPWNAGTITNFSTAQDVLNFTDLLSSAGYKGTNPFGDGTLTLSSDGHGGTDIYYHQSSTSIPITIVDLEHVGASNINTATDFLF